MSNIDVIAIAAANTYTDETVIGGGAIKGSPCTIKKIEDIEGGHKVTFEWTLADETTRSATMNVMDGAKGKDGDKGDDGRGIKSAYVNEDDHFIIVYDDDTEEDCGEITVIGVNELSELADVELDEPTNGQTLVFNEETGKWENGEGGGGTSAELSDDLTTAISVGGIDSGVTYEKGTPLESLFRDLLEPTLFPSFTNPSASLSYSVDTYYAVGSTVAAKQATVSLNRGSINPAYGTSGYRSGAATKYEISTSGADTEHSDSSTASGAFSIPTLTRSTKGNIVVTGKVTYAEGEQPKDSKGNNYSSPLPAGNVSASKTLQFILPYYYGKSASSTISDFTGLTANVTAKGQKTFNFTTNNEYMVFAYDSSYGNLKSILDGNGFETIGGWTKNTVTVGGFSYFVYVSNSPTTDTNAPFTFKY
jgi:hypothetical protein